MEEKAKIHGTKEAKVQTHGKEVAKERERAAKMQKAQVKATTDTATTVANGDTQRQGVMKTRTTIRTMGAAAAHTSHK